MRKITKKCWQCHRTFRVLEDEQYDHVCTNGCYENNGLSGSIDACGEEVTNGDEVIIHDGEIILYENAARYLIEVLGAERKNAGE
ncbi:YqaI family protein [Sutcliffiella rhizosphaerae]|uniref:Uncharacterized protein n=1 Tax=Sutcliffiella rhizosphaerae TaxID=2880967 RepID=A0ABM8YLK6_9BACI|nr:hypothetical protein [Sutcliffiella rhizosphaerae]CAG9620845.1 hypothetical protein BACCIP111883_01616 [Sutcliffiella rhizosphaerae]